ncbi:prolyl oligopeptidase family-domain-containing protein [Phlyctochytrium arcticum]|nr:prolyl oligopeptidase family-domain-containing protein [Phlyctochytrium arcticum]
MMLFKTVLAVAAGVSCAGTILAAPAPQDKTTTVPNTLQYPAVKRGDLVESYWGTPVADPYRWLEDPFSKETKSFTSEQNSLAKKYLGDLKDRDTFKSAFEKIIAYDRIAAPFKNGEYYYYFFNSKASNPQSILYRTKDIDSKQPEVFLDPLTVSPNGVDKVDQWGFSEDGTKFAYVTTKNETDYAFMSFLDVKTAKPFDTVLRFASRFSSFKFMENGIQYERAKAPEGLSWEEAGINNNIYHEEVGLTEQTWFHKWGTPQSEDRLCAPYNCAANLFPDNKERFAILEVEGSEQKLKLPLKNGKVGPWFQDFDHQYDNNIAPSDPFGTTYVGEDEENEYYQTGFGEPNFQVFSIPKDSTDAKATTIIAGENGLILDTTKPLGNGLFALTYLQDVKHVVRIVKTEVGKENTIVYEFPQKDGASTSQSVLDGNFYFKYESMIESGSIYRWNRATNKVDVWKKSITPDAVKEVKLTQEFFKSKDGATVPMFVIRPKNAKADGKNPVFTYAYGGFQVNVNPNFNAFAIALARHYGGIYALVNNRGGKEYGLSWWEDGRVFKKQNCFNDMIAAAEWFVDNKWTVPGKISIHGGSNGGLLVGAVTTQAPALFGVGLADYGVHEALRFSNFTFGPGWQDDYGYNDRKDEVLSALKWAPVYNVKPGVRYPALLVTTGDHDMRVSPLHSYKFASWLQYATQNTTDPRPAILRIREWSGHNIFSLRRYVDTYIDKVSFWATNLGVSFRR